MAQFQNATDAKQQSRRTSSLFKWTRTFENVTRHEKRGLNHRVFPISMSLKFVLSHRIQPDGPNGGADEEGTLIINEQRRNHKQRATRRRVDESTPNHTMRYNEAWRLRAN